VTAKPESKPRPPWRVRRHAEGRGVFTITVDNWKAFYELVQERFARHIHYVYRGHRQETWKLETSLDRLRPNMNARAVSEHLRDFKYSSRGRRGANPSTIESEDDWWALAQHHGLATPLLDWTASPFVAAYFAFVDEDTSDQTDHRVVWALGPRAVASASKRLPEAKRLRFIRPLSDENSRLISQSGLFVRVPMGIDIEQWGLEHFSISAPQWWRLVKVRIPSAERVTALIALARMNIHHGSLFPDLSGAATYCNLRRRIEGY
jgi:hypothetical protein